MHSFTNSDTEQNSIPSSSSSSEMIYGIGSIMFKRFVAARVAPPLLPTDSLDIWTQVQAMLTGTQSSVISTGMCCTRVVSITCEFCGRECVKTLDRDPMVKAIFKKFVQRRSFLCSRCESVRYCCKACQKNDWSDHRIHCKA